MSAAGDTTNNQSNAVPDSSISNSNDDSVGIDGGEIIFQAAASDKPGNRKNSTSSGAHAP